MENTIILLIPLAIIILLISALCKIFEKAGRSWICALIPFYNTYVLFSITTSRPLLYFILSFVPLLGAFVTLGAFINLSIVFNKPGFYKIGILLLPFIFLPIIAFGNSKYTSVE